MEPRTYNHMYKVLVDAKLLLIMLLHTDEANTTADAVVTSIDLTKLH